MGAAFSFIALSHANATPVVPPACTSANAATTACSLDGQTFNPNVPGNITTAADANGLRFIVNFTTASQSPSNVATPVVDYLALLGITTSYLGRAGSANSSTWAMQVQGITATGGNGSDGTWSLTLKSPFAGTEIGSYVAIHAGSGQSDNLFLIDSPGLSGIFRTNNGHNLSNFDLFGCATIGTNVCNGEQVAQGSQLVVPPTQVVEPVSLALLATGLAGMAGPLRRRTRAAGPRR